MERKPLKIAFGCKARSGKDTAADYLISKYGGVKLSFAKAVYDITNYIQTRCDFQVEKDRKLLQTIGTWGRSKDQDVWVNLLLKDVKTQETRVPVTNIFVTDVRFPNEFEALKKEGFFLIKIVRPSADVIAGNASSHESETSLDHLTSDSWDWTIYNNGSIEDFYSVLDFLYFEVFLFI